MQSIVFNVFCLVATSITNAKVLYEWKVFRESWKQSDSPNFVVSPFSLYPVLGSLVLASKRETQNEILYAMDADDIFDASDTYTEDVIDLADVRGVDIGLANKVYIAADAKVNPKYRNISLDFFDVEVENIDFDNTNQAAKKINNWVQLTTENHIKNFVSPPLLSGTSILLVNTIYFDGKWKYPFTSSFRGDFNIGERTITKVNYTTLTADLLYVHDDENKFLQAVSIPYQGDSCNLMVVWTDNYNLYNFIEYDIISDNPYLMNDIRSQLNFKRITLNLPVFEIESLTNLRKVLINMNIMKIFTDEAELSKVSNITSPLHLSGGYQKASIKVTSDGSKYGPVNRMENTGFNVTVDKPFYYEVRCYDVLLFNGVVTKP